MVQPEHAGVGVLQSGRALELVPKQTPESGTVVLAAVHGLEAEVELSLDDLAD